MSKIKFVQVQIQKRIDNFTNEINSLTNKINQCNEKITKTDETLKTIDDSETKNKLTQFLSEQKNQVNILQETIKQKKLLLELSKDSEELIKDEFRNRNSELYEIIEVLNKDEKEFKELEEKILQEKENLEQRKIEINELQQTISKETEELNQTKNEILRKSEELKEQINIVNKEKEELIQEQLKLEETKNQTQTPEELINEIPHKSQNNLNEETDTTDINGEKPESMKKRSNKLVIITSIVIILGAISFFYFKSGGNSIVEDTKGSKNSTYNTNTIQQADTSIDSKLNIMSNQNDNTKKELSNKQKMNGSSDTSTISSKYDTVQNYPKHKLGNINKDLVCINLNNTHYRFSSVTLGQLSESRIWNKEGIQISQISTSEINVLKKGDNGLFRTIILYKQKIGNKDSCWKPVENTFNSKSTSLNPLNYMENFKYSNNKEKMKNQALVEMVTKMFGATNKELTASININSIENFLLSLKR